jgi:hypothetical protein
VLHRPIEITRVIGHLVWRDQGLSAPFVAHPLQPIPAIRRFVVPRAEPRAVPSNSSIFMRLVLSCAATERQ